ARAPVWNTHGEVITVLPASKPFLRNLRLSIAITPLPICVRAHESVRAEARCSEPKSFQIRPVTENATASSAIYDPQKQKSPTDPCGSFGLPSRSQTSIIDGPANVVRCF